MTAAHAKNRLRALGMQRVESVVFSSGCECGAHVQAHVFFEHRSERFAIGIEVDGSKGTDPKAHAAAMVSDALALLELPVAR